MNKKYINYEGITGKKIVEILNLKKNKEGLYDTSCGPKTEMGLCLLIKRIVNEEK